MKHLRVSGWALLLTIGFRAAAVVDEVDPFIGTEGLGNCFVGATTPLGMVQAGPDTVLDGMSVCNGYRKSHLGIYGFSQTHLNGTGCPAGGDVRLLPFTGEDVAWDAQGFKDPLSERAEPGYYAVALTNFSVQVEVTATRRVAVYRFGYPTKRARLLVDLQHGLTQSEAQLHSHVCEASVTLGDDQRSLSGRNDVSAWVTRTFGFAVAFDSSWTAARRLPRLPGERADRWIFDFDLPETHCLEVRVALSSVDESGAKRNLAAEGNVSFAAARTAAREAWSRILSRVQVQGGDAERRKILYTSLYELFIQPNEMADCDGRYRVGIIPCCGFPKGGVGVSRLPDKSLYSSFSTWDTYRAAHPLYTLLAPETTEAFVESLMAAYRVNGFLPLVPFLGGETLCMIGNHSVPIVVDAFFKDCAAGGASSVDWQEVFAAVENSLRKEHPGKIKEDWGLLPQYGYYPLDRVEKESVSRLIETAYNDSCAARMAEALGKTESAAFFRARSGLWTNVFDRTYGLVRGRTAAGAWRTPFDEFQRAREWYPYDCTEADAWIYTFGAQHDVLRMIELQGGAEAFVRKLDQLFVNPVSAVTGERRSRQYDWQEGDRDFGRYEHGNEPSHHIAWLYPFAGRPDRTVELVREIATSCYRATPGGMCGNADCGQLGAWYVFAALGFYPVDPAKGEYVLGAPLFSAIDVALPQSRTLRVRAPGLSAKRRFVSRIRLNGEAIAGLSVSHAALMRGGELVFEMCDTPPGDELFGEDETVRWQAAIDAASAQGGGRVTIPYGRHPVGQLNLRSNVELHLADGAVLEGLVGLEHYQVTELPYSEGTWSAVISAIGVTNVQVSGKGEIRGNGEAWPQPVNYGGNQEGLRPRGLFFADCANIRLEDFTLRDAACWGVVLKRCETVRISRLTIDSHANLNNDGLDIEARDVVVSDCRIDTGDDAVCIKSNDPDYVVEDILVTNVMARSYCSSLKLGTASHGTMRNIRFVDCRTGCGQRDFRDRRPGHDGWWFATTARTDTFPGSLPAGARALSSIVVENVDGGVVENVSFERIAVGGSYVPIFIRGGRRLSRACGTPPSDRCVLRNISLSQVEGSAESSVASSITGVEACRVKDVSLRNVRITCRGAGETGAERMRPVPEKAGAYPEANMFDGGYLPAYGLYVRHVDGLRLEDVAFPFASGTYDRRLPVVLDDVTAVAAKDCRRSAAEALPKAEPRLWKIFPPSVCPGAYRVTLSTRDPAYFVLPEVVGVRGTFSDSGFCLMPGYPVTLTFEPHEPLTPERFQSLFRLSSLHGSKERGR